MQPQPLQPQPLACTPVVDRIAQLGAHLVRVQRLFDRVLHRLALLRDRVRVVRVDVGCGARMREGEREWRAGAAVRSTRGKIARRQSRRPGSGADGGPRGARRRRSGWGRPQQLNGARRHIRCKVIRGIRMSRSRNPAPRRHDLDPATCVRPPPARARATAATRTLVEVDDDPRRDRTVHCREVRLQPRELRRPRSEARLRRRRRHRGAVPAGGGGGGPSAAGIVRAQARVHRRDGAAAHGDGRRGRTAHRTCASVTAARPHGRRHTLRLRPRAPTLRP